MVKVIKFNEEKFIDAYRKVDSSDGENFGCFGEYGASCQNPKEICKVCKCLVDSFRVKG